MKGIMGLSAVVALLFGVVTYLILLFLQVEDALLYALLAAALSYILLSAVLRIHMRRLLKRYAQLEKDLALEYFHKSGGNFDLGGGNVKNGNIYFCEEKILCLSMEEKPFALDEVQKQDIARLDIEDIHMRIMTWDGRRYIITLPDAETIRQLLWDKNWLK